MACDAGFDYKPIAEPAHLVDVCAVRLQNSDDLAVAFGGGQHECGVAVAVLMFDISPSPQQCFDQ